MEKLSLRTLEVQEMEEIEAGSCSIGCAWLGWAAGLACAPALNFGSLLVGAATYTGCCQM